MAKEAGNAECWVALLRRVTASREQADAQAADNKRPVQAVIEKKADLKKRREMWFFHFPHFPWHFPFFHFPFHFPCHFPCAPEQANAQQGAVETRPEYKKFTSWVESAGGRVRGTRLDPAGITPEFAEIWPLHLLDVADDEQLDLERPLVLLRDPRGQQGQPPLRCEHEDLRERLRACKQL